MTKCVTKLNCLKILFVIVVKKLPKNLSAAKLHNIFKQFLDAATTFLR